MDRAQVCLLLIFASSLLLSSTTASTIEDSQEQHAQQSRQQFGHNLLPLFMMQKGYVNLNHGSFGAPPRSVIQAEHAWEAQMELNPDRWFRYQVFDEVNKVRKEMATKIAADEDDVVFVTNASHGVNAILRSIQLPKGAKALYLNLAYQMVKNTFQYLHDTFGESLIEVPIRFPTGVSAIVNSVRMALDAHPEIRLASFSHITSIPALILPVKELTALCHSRGVMVLIDGAHALGHIPINVTDINADFYLSNGHKWFYTPKGSAILWVRKDRQNLIWPTVISLEGQGPTPFQMAFSYEGTADYSAYLSFSEALKFREAMGGDDAIMAYMHNLAVSGGNLLSSRWGTETLVDSSLIGAMVNVRVPTDNATLAQNLATLLLEKYNTWVPFYPLQGKWYVRVSAQIYNEISDFSYLADSVLALISKS